MSASTDSARPAAPGLFRNLGTALLLMRGLRRKSQGWVAREAGIGKSQLSKYETGKELPKLESLGKVLHVLGVGALEFFYTLHFIDQRSGAAAEPSSVAPSVDSSAAERSPSSPAAHPASLASGSSEQPAGETGPPLFLAALPAGHALLSAATERAFMDAFSSLLALHRRVFEDLLAARSR